MINKLARTVFLILLLLSSSAYSADRVNIGMRLAGTASGVAGTVPDIDGDGIDDPATCFTVDVYDVATGLRMGEGVDCLSNITPNPTDNGLQIVGTTYFRLPSGTLVTRGLTSVQPVTHGSQPVTHITGAIPNPGDNSVISGTGAFKNAKGTVRLSGAVNMSVPGQITFDCLFIADITKSKSKK